ncbi:hypothetical protein ACFLYU_01465, partial [Candidatus Dependentiae bacterium]
KEQEEQERKKKEQQKQNKKKIEVQENKKKQIVLRSDFDNNEDSLQKYLKFFKQKAKKEGKKPPSISHLLRNFQIGVPKTIYCPEEKVKHQQKDKQKKGIQVVFSEAPKVPVNDIVVKETGKNKQEKKNKVAPLLPKKTYKKNKSKKNKRGRKIYKKDTEYKNKEKEQKKEVKKTFLGSLVERGSNFINKAKKKVTDSIGGYIGVPNTQGLWRY